MCGSTDSWLFVFSAKAAARVSYQGPIQRVLIALSLPGYAPTRICFNQFDLRWDGLIESRNIYFASNNIPLSPSAVSRVYSIIITRIVTDLILRNYYQTRNYLLSKKGIAIRTRERGKESINCNVQFHSFGMGREFIKLSKLSLEFVRRSLYLWLDTYFEMNEQVRRCVVVKKKKRKRGERKV